MSYECENIDFGITTFMGKNTLSRRAVTFVLFLLLFVCLFFLPV